MSNINTRAVIYALLVAVMALTGSDMLKAELFTNFEVSPKQIYQNQQSMISINNTGIVQADNAIVLITANSTIINFSDVCAEGQMSRLDDRTFIAEFSRMSPYMPCKFGFVASEPTSLNFKISSNGRITPWDGSLSILVPLGIIAVLLGIIILELVGLYIITKEALYDFWYSIKLWWHRKRFKKSLHTDKTICFVDKEYGVKITVPDATILEWIYYGKNTIGQLKKQSGLSKSQITYRCKKLHVHDLLDGEMKIDKTLSKYFRTNDQYRQK